jgi:KDO2-lipid IV(A) lauroyltransferase
MTAAPKVSLGLKISRAFQTALAYAFYGFCGMLSLDRASDMGSWLARKLGPHTRMSKRALNNLTLVYPRMAEADRRKIIDGMWDNIGRTAAEYAHLHDIAARIEIAGAQYVKEEIERDTGAIFFGGHLGNWEIKTVGARIMGMPLHVVYRKPNNPGVDGLLRHARDSGAIGHIEKGYDGARAILRLLKSGGAVGMLVDQKLNEGLSIPFFGRPAMTPPAMAEFAHRYGFPLYPCRVERLKGARFRLTIYPALHIDRGADRKAEVERVMTDVNRLLESWIRARPEQWLWIHRRWPESK